MQLIESDMPLCREWFLGFMYEYAISSKNKELGAKKYGLTCTTLLPAAVC